MAALAALAAAAAVGSDIALVQSSSTQNWAAMPGLNWGNDFVSQSALYLNRSAVRQGMIGFGGALTDSTAWNVMVGMNETLRSQFLTAYFDAEEGLGYSLSRITLNSADYSVVSFNYDNVTGDMDLSHFDDSLAYDNQRVIPLIRLANATASAKGSGPLRLFASPWSPPGWMKSNDNMINSAKPCLIGGPGSAYAETWAAYIVRWLTAMRAQGIEFWGLTPQNEPLACQERFESCYYSGEDMLTWLTTYLGPAVKRAFPEILVMLYDHNKEASYNWALPLLTNATALQYIDGVALHWYDYESSLGLAEVAQMQALPFYAQPGPTGAPRFMLNTEACYLQSLELSWANGELLAVDMLGDINFGFGGYVEWNHVLHSGTPAWMQGGPNHDNTTNFGDSSLLQVNPDGSAAIVFNSWYWVMGHLSRFARPGAVRVDAAGPGFAASPADYDAIRAYTLGQSTNGSLPLVASAFVAPGGAYAAVVVLNAGDSDREFKLADALPAGGGTRAARATIPAHSIQTYTFAQ